MESNKTSYLISIPKAAKEFGIGRNRLYELIYSDSTVPTVKVGEYTKINKHLFEKWLDEATQEGKKI